MALTAEQQKVLDELVAHIQDDGERKQFQALYEKYEPVRAGYLRQADYDRNLNSTKAEREREKAEVEKARTDIKKMQAWWDETQPKVTKLQEEAKSLRDKNKELDDRIKAAAATAGNGDGAHLGDQEMITKLVSEALQGRGYVSKEEVDGLVKQAANVIADERQNAFFKETLPGTMEFIMTVQDLQFQHQKEFGTSFDRHEFHKFSKEHEINDPEKAYKEFVAQKRETKKEADMRADIEKDLRSKMGMPGTGVAIEPPVANLVMDALQPKAAAAAAVHVPGPPVLATRGDIRSAALAAAAELRSEGKVA